MHCPQQHCNTLIWRIPNLLSKGYLLVTNITQGIIQQLMPQPFYHNKTDNIVTRTKTPSLFSATQSLRLTAYYSYLFAFFSMHYAANYEQTSFHYTLQETCTVTSCAYSESAALRLKCSDQKWHYIIDGNYDFGLRSVRTSALCNVVCQNISTRNQYSRKYTVTLLQHFLFLINFIAHNLPVLIYISIFHRLLWPSVQPWGKFVHETLKNVKILLTKNCPLE